MRTDLTPAELVERGHTLYRSYVKRHPDAAERGEFFMVDLKSGDVEVGSDEPSEQFAMEDRILARHPDADLMFLRVGARATYSMGGSLY